MEQKKEFSNNNDVFFTRKKIITFTILSIVIICFIVLVSTFLFDINFKKIFDLISYSKSKNNMFALWFCLMFVFPIYYSLWRILIFSYKLRKMNLKAKWYDWLLFSTIGSFLSAVTPFAIGDDPYTIFWLRKNGMTLRQATATVASVGVAGPFIQIIITWPSFFYLCSMYSNLHLIWEWKLLFWLTFMGLIFDLLGFAFYWLMSYSKNVHYFINIIFNKIRKWFRKPYKSKEEIYKEFKENASFQKEFLAELKDLKFMIPFIIGNIVWNILYYCTMIFSYKMLNPGLDINAFNLFNYVNVAVTANNFVPIPGGEGTLQVLLISFIKYGNDISSSIPASDIDTIINSMVFIWRVFTFYIIALLGMLSFFITSLIMIKRYKSKKTKIIYI